MASLPGDNSCKVFIGGLSPHSGSESLKAFFSQYGTVTDAVVMMATDKGTGQQRSRGFGFVCFESTEVVDQVGTSSSFRVEICFSGLLCEG